jgi:hypothetical protein
MVSESDHFLPTVPERRRKDNVLTGAIGCLKLEELGGVLVVYQMKDSVEEFG